MPGSSTKPTRTITEYHVVTGHTTDVLEERLRLHYLNDGWTLLGGVSVGYNATNHYPIFAQAVTREASRADYGYRLP